MGKRAELEQMAQTTGTPAPAPKTLKKAPATPTSTPAPTPTKSAPTGSLTSKELYAHVEKISQEANNIKSKYNDLIANAEACLAEARKLEAEERAAAKAKAEAEARARVAAAEAEAAAKAKAKAKVVRSTDLLYTGPVYIPAWSQDGDLLIGYMSEEG